MDPGRPLRWFTELATTEPAWRSASGLLSLTSRHELVDDAGQVYASLQWASAFGTRANAQTAGESWSFKRIGFWVPKVSVRRVGSEVNLALFRRARGVLGALRFADGQSCDLRAVDSKSRIWEFAESGSDTPIVRCTRETIRQRAGEMVIPEPSHPLAPLLSCFIWYLILSARRDADAGASGGDGGSTGDSHDANSGYDAGSWFDSGDGGGDGGGGDGGGGGD